MLGGKPKVSLVSGRQEAGGCFLNFGNYSENAHEDSPSGVLATQCSVTKGVYHIGGLRS